MSYILDALRKSEKERQAGQVPGLPDLVTETRQPSSPRWLWLAGFGLLLLNLAGLAYWLLHRQEPTPPPAEVANDPVSQPAVPARPAVATADQATPQPPIVNTGIPAPNPVVPAPVAAPTPLPEPPPATANVTPPAVAPVPAAPPMQQAPIAAAPAPVTTPPVATAAPVPVAPPVAATMPAPTPQMQVPPTPVGSAATLAPPATPPSAPVTPPVQTRKTPSGKAARTQPVTPPPVVAMPPPVTTSPTYTPPRQARPPARALPPARPARPPADEFDETDQELEREGDVMADAGRGRYAAEPQVSIRRHPPIKGGTPDLRDLPLDFQERVPPMKISMFAYSKNPAERFVIIDMRKYRAGDRLPGGILLLNIQAENLLLELDGQKFLVPRF
jgi:hypothetical protein